MTDYKSEVFMLSGFRNVKELREKSPPPTVFMNTKTAKELGLEDGDQVCIETRRGNTECSHTRLLLRCTDRVSLQTYFWLTKHSG
ncbi:hypothetical protein ES705_44002 [subsurface metagenome]